MLIAAQQLQHDVEVKEKLNELVRAAVSQFVGRYGYSFVELISDTVKKWDPKTLITKLELQVGKDLQYIRLNGTLVGGLVGLILFLVFK